MATSEARIAANRLNSLKSTGPKSARGREISRRNALKHGLTARVLRTAEEVEAVGEAAEKPPGPVGASPLDRAFIEGEIKLLSHRLERLGKMEARLRDRAALRASICWEGDQRAEAETIAAAIHRRPADVVRKLEQTPQGCLWMIDRWAMLARIADRDGAWDEPTRSLAFDLLGNPPEFRNGNLAEGIDFLGRVTDPGTDLAALARGESTRLIALRERLAEADEFDRSSTEAGLDLELGAAGHRLRAYERELHRRLNWYLQRLEETPPLVPAPRIADTPPVEAPSPAPAEPTPDEPEVHHLPIVPPMTRRERRARIAERRQAAAERKRLRRLE